MVMIYIPPLQSTCFFLSMRFFQPLEGDPINAVTSLDHPVPTHNPYGKIGVIYFYFFSKASLAAVRVRITSEDYCRVSALQFQPIPSLPLLPHCFADCEIL